MNIGGSLAFRVFSIPVLSQLLHKMGPTKEKGKNTNIKGKKGKQKGVEFPCTAHCFVQQTNHMAQ
jgi:hypothetical protein